MNIYEQLLNFVKTNTKQLCSIYIQEQQKQGPGLIFIYYAEETKDIKVMYIAEEHMTDEICKEYNNRRLENASENIIYFFVNNEKQSSFIELDIRDYV